MKIWSNSEVRDLKTSVTDMINTGMGITEALKTYAKKIGKSYDSVAGRWYHVPARKKKAKRFSPKVARKVQNTSISNRIIQDNKLVLDIKTITINDNKLVITF